VDKAALPKISGVDSGIYTFLNLVHQHKGVCRHASHFFFMVATYFGYDAQIVSNSQHSFIELPNEKLTFVAWGVGGSASSVTEKVYEVGPFTLKSESDDSPLVFKSNFRGIEFKLDTVNTPEKKRAFVGMIKACLANSFEYIKSQGKDPRFEGALLKPYNFVDISRVIAAARSFSESVAGLLLFFYMYGELPQEVGVRQPWIDVMLTEFESLFVHQRITEEAILFETSRNAFVIENLPQVMPIVRRFKKRVEMARARTGFNHKTMP